MLSLKPLSDAEPIVCVKTFVKTCYQNINQLYCGPFPKFGPSFRVVLLAESGDADVKA